MGSDVRFPILGAGRADMSDVILANLVSGGLLAADHPIPIDADPLGADPVCQDTTDLPLILLHIRGGSGGVWSRPLPRRGEGGRRERSPSSQGVGRLP